MVGDAYGITRNELYDRFREKDIYARKYFYPLTSDQACFKNKYKKVALDNARILSEQVLALPFYEKLELEQLEKIAAIIVRFYTEEE